MATYGLTTEGFLAKTLEIIRAEINAAWQVVFGDSIDVSEASTFGELSGSIAEQLAEGWELDEAIYNAFDPAGATGAALDAVCALTGTVRDPASESTVTATLTGTPTTVVPVGSTPSVTGTEVPFDTLAGATITLLTSWAGTTAYVLGDRVTNSARCYVCITAGTSAGAGGPTTTSADITDGTVHWRYIGEGTGAIDVATEAQETGPLIAASGTLQVIDTPVSGWSSVINLLDADLGEDIETDEDLRIRRIVEIGELGTSPYDSVRAALLAVDDVTSVTLFVNDSDVTDSDGVPPHAIEALVRDGADQDIWDALLANVGGGIATHGDEVGTAENSEGDDIGEEFTRPSEIDIYIALTVTYDDTIYPSDGDTQIAAAIVAYGDLQATGKDVIADAIRSVVMGITGVLQVTVYDQDSAPLPGVGSTTIAITARQLAVFDTSRITVTSGAATP